MSRVIPAGAMLIATLTRYSAEVDTTGLQRWDIGISAGPGMVASALMQSLPDLLMPLPHRLLVGAPVSLVLVVVCNGRTCARGVHFEIKESVGKPELYDTMCAEMPEFVATFLDKLPPLFDAQPFEGVPMANAPAPETPQ